MLVDNDLSVSVEVVMGRCRGVEGTARLTRDGCGVRGDEWRTRLVWYLCGLFLFDDLVHGSRRLGNLSISDTCYAKVVFLVTLKWN